MAITDLGELQSAFSQSIASTDATSARAVTANVRFPVPHPTSSTLSPAATPAKSRNKGARRRLQRPIYASYPSEVRAMKFDAIWPSRSRPLPPAGAPLLPFLEVALRLVAGDRKKSGQRTPARNLLLGEVVIQRGFQRLLGYGIHDVGGNHHHAVAIADDDVAGEHRHATAPDRQVEVDRVVCDRARGGGRPAVIGRQGRGQG